MEIREVITYTLLLIGSAFVLLAAVGIVRLPDILMRMHSTSKAATLGAALMLAAVAVHFGEVGVTTRVIAAIIFLFITAPVGAHMLARATYFLGVPLWDRMVLDELKGNYDEETHRLTTRKPEDDEPAA
jgi:multicomponent Na+:H+ antiporter subunit G